MQLQQQRRQCYHPEAWNLEFCPLKEKDDKSFLVWFGDSKKTNMTPFQVLIFFLGINCSVVFGTFGKRNPLDPYGDKYPFPLYTNFKYLWFQVNEWSDGGLWLLSASAWSQKWLQWPNLHLLPGCVLNCRSFRYRNNGNWSLHWSFFCLCCCLLPPSRRILQRRKKIKKTPNF